MPSNAKRYVGIWLAAVGIILGGSAVSAPQVSAQQVSAQQVSAQQAQYSSLHRGGERALPQTIRAGSGELGSKLAAKLAGGRSGISLAVVDFDGDGTQDLITGYAVVGGGAFTLQRGSMAATSPSAAEWAAMQRGELVSPFAAKAEATELPVQPDFLKAADIDGNGTVDLVVAAHGGDAAYVLLGDGRGGFGGPQKIALNGTITALATWSGPDGANYVVAGVCGAAGCGLRVMSADGVVKAAIAVPSAVSAIEAARLNGGGLADLAVVSGGNVLLVDGDAVLAGAPKVEALPVSGVASVATGSFVYDRRGYLQIAVLDTSAVLHVLARPGVDSRAVTAADVVATRRAMSSHAARAPLARPGGMGWAEVETVANVGPGGEAAPLMLRGVMSAAGGDDLVVMAGGQYVTVAHTSSVIGGVRKTSPVVTIDSTGGVIAAAVAARMSPDARQGMVTIDRRAQPNITLPSTDKTWTVNTTTDSLDNLTTTGRCTTSITCSLRDAIGLANKDFSVNGTSEVDTIVVPAGTYTLSITNGSSEDSGRNLNYHLDLDASMNILGAGSGSTIINANSLDKVFSADSGIVNAIGTYYIFMSGMTLENGVNGNNPNLLPYPTNNYGGLIDWESNGNGYLTLNHMVLNNGEAKWGPGGAVFTSNSASGVGTLEIDNSTISNSSTPEQGGGIYNGFDVPMILSAVTVTGNEALASVNSGDGNTFLNGGGLELGSNATALQTTITNSTFSGNTVTGQGGGIDAGGGFAMTGTVVSGNSALYGGGLDLETLDTAGTITESTFTGNSVSGTGADGGGICLAPAGSADILTMHYSRIHGNTGGTHTGLGIGCQSGSGSATANVTDNWWGCNGAASGTGCDTAGTTAGTATLTTSPYSKLTLGLSTTTPAAGSNFTATGSLGQDSSGTTYTPAQDAALSGVAATLAIVQNGGGTTNSLASSLDSNAAIATTATATALGAGTATVTVDGTSVSLGFTVSAPDMTVTSSHSGNFKAGDSSDSYMLMATNAGNAPTSGTVTVVDTLPAGFTATGLNGSGWSCTLGTLTCTRSDALNGTSAYPQITVNVSVSGSDIGTYSNSVTVSGGGESNTSNDSYNDATIVVGAPTFSAAFGPATIAVNGTSTLTFTIGNPSANVVTLTGIGFSDPLPTNVKVANPNVASGNCSGTFTAPNGSSSITLSGTTLAPGTSCTVSVNVTSGVASVYTDTTGAITATNSNAGPSASPVLTVVAAPVANPQSVNVPFNTATGITLTGSGTGTLTYNVIANPAHGVLSGTAPNLTYTPTTGYTGADSFTFQVNNGVPSNTATVSITVLPAAPVANGQSVTVPYNTATAITLTATGSGTLTYSVIASPGHGTLSGTAPNLTYTPTAGYSGADSFTFQANNGTPSNTATVAITVLPAAPVANGQSVTVAYNTATAVTLTATGSGTLTYSVITNPTHGVLSGSAPNLTYTPNAGYSGGDSFTFQANNGTPSNTATVTLNVLAAAPVANGQSVTVPYNTATAVTLTATGSGTLTYSVITNPSHGVLSGSAPNLTYTPTAGYSGGDSFTFQANNGTPSNTATVTLNVLPAGPVANPQSVTTAYNTATAITLTASGTGTLTYSVVASPSHGVLSGTAPNLTYTPTAGYYGSDSFTFQANNGTPSNVATVSITVLPAAPVANGQNVTVPYNTATAVILTATGNGTLTYSVITNPAHGTLSGSAPNLTYTPNAGYIGGDSFTFQANNGTPSNIATVTLNVLPAGPVANSQSVTTPFNTAVGITLTATGTGTLTYSIISNPAHGALSGSAPNVTYTPTGGYAGPDSFTFQANNGTPSNTATVSITVALPASKLVYGTAPLTPIASGGNAGIVTVQEENASNGVVTTASDTITLTVSGPGGYSQQYNVAAVNGVAAFNLTGVALTISGTYTYTASSGALTPAVATEGVGSGAVTTLSVTGLGSYAAPGMPGTVTVTALDASNNIVTSFAGTVTLSSSDALATLPGAYTFVPSDNGVHVFNITLNTAGLQSVTATSGALSGTVTSILVADSVWMVNADATLAHLTSSGVQIATAGSGSGSSTNTAVAFDSVGDVWAVDNANSSVREFSRSGGAIAVPGNAAAGVNAPVALAIDGVGQVWVANGNGTVSVLSATGAALTPSTGYLGGATQTPTGIIIDSSGSVWMSNKGNTVTKIIGGAAPVVTPTVTGTANNTLGTEP